MTEILHWDQELFHLINIGWKNSFSDFLMPMLRNKYIWVPVYIFLGSFILLNLRKKGFYVMLSLILCIGLSDSINSRLIKKTVKRERPCKIFDKPQDIQLLVNCGAGYSFPSSHAANHFALSFFLILVFGRIYPWIKIPLLLWAASICFAQVYVGVHYPLDVLAGSILGIFIASSVHLLFRSFVRTEAM